MNEHTLPDDCSRWPNDPFELLGVSPGATERDLKRAYARLIRTYKPEQFPEHFRRIREAYETAQRITHYYSAFGPPPDTPPAQTEQTPEPAARPEELPTPLPLPRSLDQELDDAWDRAVEGDEVDAYARLLALHDRHPDSSETCLRLYSLLRVAPELDARRTPCDFLAHGLRQTGGSGPCHELYRREVEDQPAEALTERFMSVLNATTQPGLLTTLTQWRWFAAGAQERLDIIGADLPELRTRFGVDQEETWVRLLMFAADQLAWSPTSAVLFMDCLSEIQRHVHLQLRCPDVFDRVEYLERVAAGWHALRETTQVPASFFQLLAHYWTRPFAGLRRDVVELLADIHADRSLWLEHFDTVNAASPDVLSVLGQVFDSYRWTLDAEEDAREPAELLSLAWQFLEEHGQLRYRDLRPRLLAFCLREWIHPDTFTELVVRQAVALPTARAEKLVNDWPLRYVYRACTLFGS